MENDAHSESKYLREKLKAQELQIHHLRATLGKIEAIAMMEGLKEIQDVAKQALLLDVPHQG